MNEITTHDEPTTWEKAIFYAMTLVGFNPKNINSDELFVILDNLKRNHKQITLGKFREAFELGANGKLDINLNSYQNFNTLYISNVIGAYKRYLAANLSRAPRIEYRKPEGVKMRNGNVDRRTPYSTAEGEKQFIWTKDIILDTNKLPIIANWQHVCRWMEETKLIDMDEAETEARDNVMKENFNFRKNKNAKIKQRGVLGGLDSILPVATFGDYRAKELIKEYFKNELTKN